jgi:DNA excision repair protein ERCC-4
MGENRQRFERELHRLRGFRFARLLVVGNEEEILQGKYRSNIKPQAVMGTICAFEARYVPVAFSQTPVAAARLVERYAYWFCTRNGRGGQCPMAGARGITAFNRCPGLPINKCRL